MISKLTEAVNQNFRNTREMYSNMSFDEIIKEFRIPSEIKTDLLYCQHNLKNFFKVHIALTGSHYGNQHSDALRKNLDELEYVISEINAEQKYLLLRLRRVMEEYFKLLKKIGIPIDNQKASNHISQQIKCSFTASNRGLPCSVKRRPSYEELLRRFDIYEAKKIPSKSSITAVAAAAAAAPKQLPPVSLLKPKEERLHTVKTFNNDDNASSQVNRSRLNLRQALSKVIVQTSSPSNSETTSSPETPVVKKKSPPPPKNPIPTVIPECTIKKKSSSDSNSSSETESNERSREQTPENVEINADTQETFLRLLKLCTVDQAMAMSQRRSKRKRRCVQNNDKPDFLYGHIDFDHSRDENKRRKTLLMSPPGVVRNLRQNQSSNKCNECEAHGNENSLRNCTDCLGYFHDSCHSVDTISKKTRASSCPSCVRIYANAVKDRNQKIEANKESKRIAKLEMELEIDVEGEDEISQETDEPDYENVEIITC